jgi:Holliday junction resolvase RusA-like endonuclease
VPQGSKNAVVVRKRGKNGKPIPETGKSAYRAVMYEQEKNLEAWRNNVKLFAKKQLPENWDGSGCFANWSIFFFPRPQYHYDRHGKLKPEYGQVLYKKTKPDGDKCLRALNDSITGVVFSDDAQVVPGFGMTAFADPGLPGALVTIVKLS